MIAAAGWMVAAIATLLGGVAGGTMTAIVKRDVARVVVAGTS